MAEPCTGKQQLKSPPPLAGLKVLRLGTSRAGNFLERLLADQGATVETASHSGDRMDASRVTSQARNVRVVIDDLGRGEADRLGVGFDTLAKGHPDLVYCQLTSYPDGGPEGHPDLLDEPLNAILGLNRRGGEPIQQEPLAVPSFLGAVLAGIYIVAALLPRVTRQGGPQRIEMPLFSACINLIGRELFALTDKQFGDPGNTARLPISELYQCADERWVQPHGTYERFARIICEVGGHPEWAEAAAAGLQELPDKQTEAMWRERFKAMYKTRSALDWERDITAGKGACTMIRTRDEWVAEEHPYEAGILIKDPRGGVRVGPGSVVVPNASTPADVAARRKELDGADKGHKPLPLAGLKVVDFTIVLAGPTCGRILSELGADVIKIDDPARFVRTYGWLDVNRGKRSAVIDMSSPKGRAIVRQIIGQSDIVLQNFRKGKLAQFGLGYEQIAPEQPDIIYASMNAFDADGRWSTRPGWEHNAQAACGTQMVRLRNGAPRQVPFPGNDYGTGMLGAFGVMVAVYVRATRGQGSFIKGSLARTSTFMQMEEYEAGAPYTRKAPATRTYPVADGFVTVLTEGSNERQLETWAAAAREQRGAEALKALYSLGMKGYGEPRGRQLLETDWLARQKLVRNVSHPDFGEMLQACPKGTVTHFSVRDSDPAPEPGTHTEELLAEFGFGSEVGKLIETGVAHGRMPLLFKGGD
jgi:crotonobetainyl-CoA:carnitine CoA-transferase CaiB-like acyl-CoA transferase